jgi:hypothetical protein
MSRMGGFDFVCQIRRDKLLKLMQETFILQGQPLVAPLRLSRGDGPARKIVDLVVRSVDLALEAGTNLGTLVLALEGGVIRLPDEPEASFTGGELHVRVQFPDGSFLLARALAAELKAPATAVTAGIRDFVARSNREVDRLIDAERNVDVDVYPGSGGMPKLTLFGRRRNLDAQTFCAFAGSGRAEELAVLVDAATPVSFALSAAVLSPFLPSADQLTEVARKSTTIDLTITRADYTFRDGGIDIDGGFDAEDDCWSIDGGSFSQRAVPALVSQNVVFRAEPPAPLLQGTVDVGFLCELGLATIMILEEVIDPNALFFGPTWLKTLGIKLSGSAPATADSPAPPTLALGEVTWRQVTCSPEGLTLLGDHPGGGPSAPAAIPAIHLRTREDPQNLHGVARGTVTVRGPGCEPRDFGYEESIQDDRNTLTVETDWLLDPVQYTWTVDGQPLTPASPVPSVSEPMLALDFIGTVTTALPPPSGTPIAGHAIRLLYLLRGSSLTLAARNEDANYSIRVEVRARDALGRSFSDAANLTMVGDIVEFGTDYDDYMDACLKAVAGRVNAKGRQRGRVKPGEPQESWRELLDAVTLQAQLGDAEAEALVPALKRTFGTALVGRSAGRTGQL